ncbi:hypothetical protein C4D60_Mb08t09400 [Musa balbisiana]|uniref:Uncharacterized protein n=1 Tax=Musa balbisiana TaxID=52838 RepID=A0A4S8K2I2_MUSBA|nr:hypothetical protein C4D60_Mb08t09400 [Musa balbisiana]
MGTSWEQGSDGGNGGCLRCRNILSVGEEAVACWHRWHAVEPNVEVEVVVVDGVRCDLGTREVSLLAVALQLL